MQSPFIEGSVPQPCDSKLVLLYASLYSERHALSTAALHAQAGSSCC